MSGCEFTDQIPVIVENKSSGQSFEVVISPDATVAELIEEVKKHINFDTGDMALIFGNKALEDKTKSLRSYGIQRDSVLWFYTRARGGLLKV